MKQGNGVIISDIKDNFTGKSATGLECESSGAEKVNEGNGAIVGAVLVLYPRKPVSVKETTVERRVESCGTLS